MNKIEHLLTCLTEECAEIIKEADKALRFGLDDVNPFQKEKGTNRERIHNEIQDLYGVIELLNEAGVLPSVIEVDRVKKKREKVEKYMKFAKELGTLKDE